jgi:hypothetical protein
MGLGEDSRRRADALVFAELINLSEEKKAIQRNRAREWSLACLPCD